MPCGTPWFGSTANGESRDHEEHKGRWGLSGVDNEKSFSDHHTQWWQYSPLCLAGTGSNQLIFATMAIVVYEVSLKKGWRFPESRVTQRRW